jgi:general secretion pathway protein N
MRGFRLTPALIAMDALLAIALAVLWLAPGPIARWRNWQAPASQAPNLDAARAAQFAPNPALRRDYPAITERPLFAADRKPRAAASDGAAAAPIDSIDQAKLYGLVDGPASQGALVEQGGQPQFVRLGEKIGDWTLHAIEGRNAIFVKGDERRTVPLPDSLTDAAALSASAPASAASMPASTPALLPFAAPMHPSAQPQPLRAPIPAPTPALLPGAAPRPAPPPSFGGKKTSVQTLRQPAVSTAGNVRRIAYGDDAPPPLENQFLNQTGPARIGSRT